MIEDWLKKQPPSVQKAVLYAQNFFKHGFKDLNGQAHFSPLYGEMLILESAAIHESLYGAPTPLMHAFILRFVSENPRIVSGRNRDAVLELIKAHPLEEDIEIDELLKLSRADFLAKLAPALLQGGAVRFE